jgi:hypothetical protein
MGAKEEAARLSRSMREMLVAHVRENQPIDYTIGSVENLVRRSSESLQVRGLISPEGHGNKINPTSTVLTDLGREVVCHVLGEYADGLVTAGVLDHPQVIRINRLRSAYSPVMADEIIVPADKTESSALVR